MSLSLQDVLTVTNPALLAADGVTAQNAEDFKNLMMAFLATEQFGSFPVTAWSDGSVPVALLQTDAQQLSRLAKSIYDAVGPLDPSTLNTTTNNLFVDLWAFSQYQELRNPLVLECISILLTNTSGTPINLDANELNCATSDGSWVGVPVGQSGSDDTGKPLFTPTAVSIKANDTLTVSCQALPDCIDATSPPSSDVNTVQVPHVPGLRVTSLATGALVEVQRGSPVENDVDFYRRLQSKWPARSLLRGNTHQGWLYWCDAFGLAFRRPPLVLDADDPRNAYGGGHVVIVLDAGGADLTAITQWLVAHKPLNMPKANLHVVASQPVNVSVGGTIYAPTALQPNINPSLQIAINDALAKYSAGLADSGLVAYFDVVWIIRGVPGVVRLEGLTLNGLAVDVSLSFDRFAAFADVTNTITWTLV